MTPKDIADRIFATFAARGGATYGERITQLEHALQCAALAEAEGASDTMVAAALLHDFGHFFEGRGDAAELEDRDAQHEAHGALMLKPWFGPEVAGPVALHVQAKRYLCAVEAGYEAALSPASALSLRLQGGRFTPEEAQRFAAGRYAQDAIRLRRWDDAGKVEDVELEPLQAYRPLLETLAAKA